MIRDVLTVIVVLILAGLVGMYVKDHPIDVLNKNPTTTTTTE